MAEANKTGFTGSVRAIVRRVDASVTETMVRRTVAALIVIAAFGTIVVSTHVARVERQVVHATALDKAIDRLSSVDQFRSLDLSHHSDDNAVLRAHKPNRHAGTPALPVPGTFEFALAERITRASDNAVLRFYSAYPFPSNPKGGLPDSFAGEAWRVLRSDPSRDTYYRFVQTKQGRVLRYAVAERMRPQCVACHNESAWSPKREWEVGEVAGIVEIDLPEEPAAALAQSAAFETFLLLCGFIGGAILLVGFLLRKLKTAVEEAQRLAVQTEETNRALAREVEQRARAEAALSAANEKLSANHSQLEQWAADLEIAHTRLREIDELKTKFLSEVSHELRSPVAAIVSAAKIITKHHATKPEVVERFGKTIISEGERMTRLINEFLDLTKIESGCIEWSESEIDPESLVNAVLLSADALALDGGIQLIQAVEPNLPKLRVDEDRLTQVLTNLLNNAIKYTPSGGSITVRAARHGNELLFAVDDTGPGIPADEIPTVFDRFRQVRAERYDGKKRVGTGLGLCISREIVQHYGGRIWVESEVGSGSSFCFTIPLQPQDHRAGDSSGSAMNGNGAAHNGPRARIAILIEERDLAKRACRVAMAAGLDCRTLKSADELIALHERWTPDVYVISAALLQQHAALAEMIRSNGAHKLLVYSPEHGVASPSLLDSADLLVPTVRTVVPPPASVLVVDDDEKYRGILEFEFEQAGFRVDAASDGRSALQKIREGGIDAVVLDLVMPGMDGLAVLEQLEKAGGVRVPIFVYTAMDEPSVAIAARAFGAREVFRKAEDGKAPTFTAVTARVRRIMESVLAAHATPPDEERAADEHDTQS